MKSKYLTDLYGNTDYGFKEDSGKLQKQRDIYGFDSRDCWNLDYTFVEWLYCHLKMYLEDASAIVDLTYHKFSHDEKEYTQLEAIEYIIDRCEFFLLDDKYQFDENPHEEGSKEYYDYMIDVENKSFKDMQDAIKLFAEIFPSMWW